MKPALRRLLVVVALCLLPAGRAQADLVVIVNARNGVAAMSRSDVINLFFGRNRQFFNGIEAEPVDVADSHPNRAYFYRLLVGKELPEVDAYWSRLVFTGRQQALPRLSSSDEVVRWVASHPGGIGFVEISKADARVRVVYELKP